jgi:peptidoglycan-associated lipoprotein
VTIPAPAATAPAGAPVPARAPTPDPIPISARCRLVPSEAVRQSCQLSAPESHFACDESAFEAPAQQMIQQLADCLTQGPLRGRILRLIGHTDPRGAQDYAMLLGQRLAVAVAQRLTALGLGAGQIQVSSRGGMDATGHDEASWAEDRRVDVQ